MSYASYTRDTKEPLKRIAHSVRFDGAAKLISLRPDMKVLDYGCGDGGFFEVLRKLVPEHNLFGFDPYLLKESDLEGIITYQDADKLLECHPDFFDLIYCMEVCEHLTDSALHQLFKNLRAVGKKDAKFVFGVPLEVGVSGFMKNIYRTLYKNRQRATFGKALKSLCGITSVRQLIE